MHFGRWSRGSEMLCEDSRDIEAYVVKTPKQKQDLDKMRTRQPLSMYLKLPSLKSNSIYSIPILNPLDPFRRQHYIHPCPSYLFALQLVPRDPKHTFYASIPSPECFIPRVPHTNRKKGKSHSALSQSYILRLTRHLGVVGAICVDGKTVVDEDVWGLRKWEVIGGQSEGSAFKVVPGRGLCIRLKQTSCQRVDMVIRCTEIKVMLNLRMLISRMVGRDYISRLIRRIIPE